MIYAYSIGRIQTGKAESPGVILLSLWYTTGNRLGQIGYQATTEVRIKTHASILTHYCIPVSICTGTCSDACTYRYRCVPVHYCRMCGLVPSVPVQGIGYRPTTGQWDTHDELVPVQECSLYTSVYSSVGSCMQKQLRYR